MKENAPAAELPYWGTKGDYAEIKGRKYYASRYCGNGLPRHTLPTGYYLVHNHVRPTHALGRNGFRAWVQKGCDCTKIIECNCDFGGMKNNAINKHYRVIIAPDRLN